MRKVQKVSVSGSGSGWERVKVQVQVFEEVEEVLVEDKDLCVEVEVEETGVEVDSQDGRLVVKLRAQSCAGGVAMIAQSSIMQPAMRMTNPAELRDLVMAAPPS